MGRKCKHIEFEDAKLGLEGHPLKKCINCGALMRFDRAIKLVHRGARRLVKTRAMRAKEKQCKSHKGYVQGSVDGC